LCFHKHQVPHFAAFLFLSIFPQFPLIVFMSYLCPPMTPFDQIGGAILLLFLLAQLIDGFRTIRAIIRYQTARFMLDPPENDDDGDNSAAVVGGDSNAWEGDEGAMLLKRNPHQHGQHQTQRHHSSHSRHDDRRHSAEMAVDPLQLYQSRQTKSNHAGSDTGRWAVPAAKGAASGSNIELGDMNRSSSRRPSMERGGSAENDGRLFVTRAPPQT
jgi:hypothetical protein